MIEQMEIPSELRAVISKNSKKKTGSVQPSDIGKFLDGLSFPFLTTSVLLAANFTSSKVMYNARPLLEAFSKDIGKLEHPKRMLWLTDTFEDKNGVSMVLQEMLSEIKKHDLPIDILTCSSTLENDDHLIVVRPKAEFTLPFYKNQPIRIPDFMEIHNLFHENEYDRIMSSTEGIMGIASLYLKQAYTVKAHFFMHTDWLTFARKALQIDRHNLNRVRRVLRAFYKAFDGVFVLNSDHKKWLTGNEIGLNEEDVHLTAHWVDEKFKPRDQQKEELFGLHNNEPVLLYAGRISKEKGVMEIQETYYKIKEQIPNVKLVFAGTGPDEEKLKEDIAEAIFTGWINHDDLPSYYSSADLVILPSRFDTFSVVVLEALSCGTPVIAYNTKGPKDIIQHGESGYLANNKGELNNYAIQYFTKLGQLSYMRKNAAKRAKNYAKNDILNKLLNDVGFEMQIKNKHTCPIAQ
jgi:glycosyltransferase involved in cell wall biosynthesis